MTIKVGEPLVLVTDRGFLGKDDNRHKGDDG